MGPTDAIQKFDSHLRGMRLFLDYVFFVQSTFPHLCRVVPRDRWPELQDQLEAATYLAREIYRLPTLGSSPPDPLPVDQDCPEHLMSDHMKERVGRNHPFFDVVNAPFTHPIGTQLAMICIDHAWNAYDTFIKSLLSEIKTRCPKHANVERLAAEGASASTDAKLNFLHIGTTAADLEGAARLFLGQMRLLPEHVELTIKAAKELRTAFAHNFGRPTPWLLDLMQQQSYQHFTLRMVDDELEVTTVLSRNIIEAITLKAHLIDENARRVYEQSFSAEKAVGI